MPQAELLAFHRNGYTTRDLKTCNVCWAQENEKKVVVCVCVCEAGGGGHYYILDKLEVEWRRLLLFPTPNDAGSRVSNTQYWENLVLVVVLISEFQGDVTRDDSQRRNLVQHGVAILEQYCNHSK